MTANQPIRYTYTSRCVAQNNTCIIDHIDPVVVYIIGSTCIVLGFVAFADIKHSLSGKSYFSFTHAHTHTCSTRPPIQLIDPPCTRPFNSSLPLHCTMSSIPVTLSARASSCFIGFRFWWSMQYNGVYDTWAMTRFNKFNHTTHTCYSKRRMFYHWSCSFWNHAIDPLTHVSFSSSKR